MNDPTDDLPTRNSEHESTSDDAFECVARAIEVLETLGEAGYHEHLATLGDRRPLVESRVGRLRKAGMVGLQVNAGATEPFERVGPYRILRRIGSGGMGVVFLAEDERLRRRVALKTLTRHASLSATARARFAREAVAVAKLSHPGIVPLFESGEESGVPWFTMEYVEGKTLADVISGLARLGLPPGELTVVHLAEQMGLRPEHRAALAACSSFASGICLLLSQVALALDHAHRLGVLHRDVKPSNILITPTGRARIFDFGLAQVEGSDRLTLSKDFAGTPYYTAPEQAEGDWKEVDARTDVWALGVSLFECLTLGLPFKGETTDQVLRRIRQEEPPWPRRLNPQISRDLEIVVLTALEKKKPGRYATSAMLAQELDRAQRGDPVEARPISATTRFLRLAWRRKAVTAAVVLLALLVIGGTVGMLIFNRSIRRERDRAEVERDVALKMFNFLSDTIFEASVEESGPNTPISEIVAGIATQARESLAKYPEYEARILQRVGAWYMDMNDFERSEALLREALTIQRAALSQPDAEMARTENFLGMIAQIQSRPYEATRLFRSAARHFRAADGEASLDALRADVNCFRILVESSQYDDADRVLEATRPFLPLLLESSFPDYLSIRSGEAGLLNTRHRSTEAEAVLRELIRICESRGETNSVLLGQVLSFLSDVLRDQGRAKEALEAAESSRDVYQQIFGRQSWQFSRTTNQIASALALLGQGEEAVCNYWEAIAVADAVIKIPNHSIVFSYRKIAEIECDRGEFEAARWHLILPMVAYEQHRSEESFEGTYNRILLAAIEDRVAPGTEQARFAAEIALAAAASWATTDRESFRDILDYFDECAKRLSAPGLAKLRVELERRLEY